MTTIIIQFTLMGINLFIAKYNKKPASNYFAAGMCLAFGLQAIFKLI
jgi:hypothetical protein